MFRIIVTFSSEYHDMLLIWLAPLPIFPQQATVNYLAAKQLSFTYHK